MNLQLAAGNFYGKTLKQYQVGGFSLSETRYTPGSTLPAHSHESHFFCFILSGTYREAYERKVRYCGPAMIVYHPAGEHARVRNAIMGAKSQEEWQSDLSWLYGGTGLAG